ncbi:MAG: hypothetical protein JWM19_6194 [Actinomycetia bacterium]|nr:hypothetical protein [Actinomycetes bacterium]
MFAAERDIKLAHIVLDRGSTPSQPMLTLPGHGTLAAQVEAAGSLSRDLAAAGFTVARVKVEAAPTNEDIPSDDTVVQHHEHGLVAHVVRDGVGGMLAGGLGDTAFR